MEVFVRAPTFGFASWIFPEDSVAREVLDRFVQTQGWGSSGDLYLLHNGRRAAPERPLQPGAVYQLQPRLCGGKGGFGSMLRALGAQIEKTTNREACRDLSGRRLRDVNHEKEMADWLKKQAEREAEREQQRAERLQRRLREPEHRFSEQLYLQQSHQLSERLEDSVIKGLQATSGQVRAGHAPPSKRHRNQSKEPHAKRNKMATCWTGLEELRSSEEDDDEGSEDSASTLSPSSAEPEPEQNSRDQERGPGPSRVQQEGPGPSRDQETGPGPSRVQQEGPGPCKDQETGPGPCKDQETGPGPSRDQETGPGPSRDQETGPGPCKDQETGPGPSRDQETGPGPSRVQQEGPGPSRVQETGPGPSRVQETGPGPSRDQETGPGPSRDQETRPGPSRVQQEGPGPSRDQETRPGPSRVQQEGPGPSRDQETGPSEQVQPGVDLTSVTSVEQLELLGLDVLKEELRRRGLKCGGTLAERAGRLFSIRGLAADQVDPVLLAKPPKARKRR